MRPRELGKWTDEADSSLYEQVRRLTDSWSRVSKALQAEGFLRTDAQCRDRWISITKSAESSSWNEASIAEIESGLSEAKQKGLELYEQVEYVVERVNQKLEDDNWSLILNPKGKKQYQLGHYRMKALQMADPEAYENMGTWAGPR